MKTFKQFQEDYARVINPVKPVTDLIGATLGAAELGKKAFSGLSNIFQAKRSQDTKKSRGRRSENKPKRKLSRMQQKMIDLENKRGERVTNTDPNKGINRKRETFNNPTNLSKPEGEFHTNEFQPDKSMTEEAPTNNVGGGQIAGTVEAGDDPPVKKGRKKKKGKKKRYIYGGTGSRRMWMKKNNK